MFQSSIYNQDPRLSQMRNVHDVRQEIDVYENQFDSRVIYARKLFFALMIQMIVIATACWIVHVYQNVGKILTEKYWIFWVCLIISIGVATVILIFRKECQQPGINFFLFTVFTIAAAIVAATLVSLGNSLVGLLVFVSLATIIFFMFMYSLTVKKRATQQGAILFLSAAILLVFEVFTIFSDISLFWLIAVSLGAFFVAFLIIYDTYTNINSGEQFDATMQDQFSGSVVIYWDIILLFLRMNELIKDYLIRDRQ